MQTILEATGGLLPGRRRRKDSYSNIEVQARHERPMVLSVSFGICRVRPNGDSQFLFGVHLDLVDRSCAIQKR